MQLIQFAGNNLLDMITNYSSDVDKVPSLTLATSLAYNFPILSISALTCPSVSLTYAIFVSWIEKSRLTVSFSAFSLNCLTRECISNSLLVLATLESNYSCLRCNSFRCVKIFVVRSSSFNLFISLYISSTHSYSFYFNSYRIHST